MNPNDTKPEQTPQTPEPTPPTATDTPTVTSTAPEVPAATQTEPESSPAEAPAPAATVSSVSTEPPKPAKKHKKLFIILGSVVAFLLIAGAAFWFAFWNNPTYVYSNGLSNAGRGFQTLTDYLGEEVAMDYEGYTGTGKFALDSGGTNVEGGINYRANQNSAELQLDADLLIQKIDLTVRSISDGKSTPELFVKAGNIKGLGALTGFPELAPVVDQLSDKWISVDPELLESVQQGVETANEQPTKEQIVSAVEAVNKVNREYVFTSNEDKAVIRMVEVVGKETIDGHTTYRYKVSPVKQNIKDYINAQKAAIASSELNDWIKKNNYQSTVDDAFKSMLESADDIDEKYTFDLWSDINRRVLYKVRFADSAKPKTDYVEVGLDYKGGDNYPVFVTAVTDKGTAREVVANFRVNINTDVDSVSVTTNYAQKGTEGGKFNFGFNAKPTNAAVKIDKPADALPLSEVFQGLGFDGATIPN